MTPRRFTCTQFRKGILDYSLECITLLQNDFFKQRYMTYNVTIPGQDTIDPNTYLCRTFFTEYILLRGTDTNFGVLLPVGISFNYQTSYCTHKHELTVLLPDKSGQTVMCLLPRKRFLLARMTSHMIRERVSYAH